MPFFVYGRDAQTGEVARRRVSNAATAAEARAEVERLGIEVTSVLPSPELIVASSLHSDSKSLARPVRVSAPVSVPSAPSIEPVRVMQDALPASAAGAGTAGRDLRIAARILLVCAAIVLVFALNQHGLEQYVAALAIAMAGTLALVVAWRMRRKQAAGAAPPSARLRFASRTVSVLCVVAAFAYLGSVSIPRVAWNPLNLQAMAYARKGERARALQLEKIALLLAERSDGVVSVAAAVCANNLGKIYLDSTQYKEAEPLFQRALAIREKLLRAEHPDIAQSLYNLAAVRVNQQEFAQAQPLLERALAIQEKSLPADSPDIAMTLNGLGLIAMSRGQFADAEQDHQRALAIREKNGAANTDVAESLANLAAVYLNENRYADAAPLFTRALSIWQPLLDEEHPNIALCLDGLGTAYMFSSQYAQAEPLLKHALVIREHVYGAQHPVVAGTVESLALLHRRQGQYALAEPLYERLLAIEEAAQPADSPLLASIFDGVAQFYREAGKPERADELAARATAIRTQRK